MKRNLTNSNIIKCLKQNAKRGLSVLMCTEYTKPDEKI